MNRLRMCISCRKMKPKRELIRIIRDIDGKLDIDESYKLQTRGTYICKDMNCILKLKKSVKVKKQFKINDDPEFYDRLEKNVEN